ncbi:DUF4260 domain-containing protein [Sulfitobacter sediminilitoris]|uniref:DUF4260 domain-containing protein n=2 Tax=Sulfitobacter sediminilitoris TaxID=2698830 RepID=UPI003606A3BE
MMSLTETRSASPVFNPIALILRLEGLAVVIAALLCFGYLGGSWMLFALLILSPDLMMLGYLRGPRLGALLYNLGHSYFGPSVLGGAAFIIGNVIIWQLALIWVAHIGLDRALGFGLKYGSGFKETHLGRV